MIRAFKKVKNRQMNYWQSNLSPPMFWLLVLLLHSQIGADLAVPIPTLPVLTMVIAVVALLAEELVLAAL